MGHRRAGAVPRHHERLLPRRSRGVASLRHHQEADVRQCPPVAPRAPRPRRLQHRHHAGREQVRPQPPEGCLGRDGGGHGREGELVVPRDVGAGGAEHRERVPEGPARHLPHHQPEGAGRGGGGLEPRGAPSGDRNQRREFLG